MGADDAYDVVAVGTGFATSFFLDRCLALAGPRLRVRVLERGRDDSHAWQIEHGRNSSLKPDSLFSNRTPAKPWIHTPGFGGGSNCWWGVTPRMLPSDFEMRTRYGIGRDWPIRYEDLEPYYADAEQRMSVSGPSDESPFPRSRPYPQPPHRMSEADAQLHEGFPGLFYHQPTARARVATGRRPGCCATGNCDLCPIDAKFRIGNEMRELYGDPRIELSLESTVLGVETQGNLATGVRYREGGIERVARGDLIVLGANAIFNPHLLLASSIGEAGVGEGLCEQVSTTAILYLRGVRNFGGSTSLTGHGYMFYDGEHRRDRAACLVETWNAPPRIRSEFGRWTERLDVKFIFEDLPQRNNRVSLDPARRDVPTLEFHGHSEYAKRGLESVESFVGEIAKRLPVEDYWIREPAETEAHVLCTAPMGDDPASSVVDRQLVHHRVRNLVVLGGSAFASCSPANPTLTISALSLWSAQRLFGRAAV